MQPLPRDFLQKIARQYDLSEEQKEAFVELFNNCKKQEQAAENIHITPGAFRTRMSGVYRKFNFNGKNPNKARNLHDFLLKEYQKFNHNTNNIPGIDPSNIDSLVKEIRKKIRPYIQEKCGTMKVLTMSQPIELNEIYTNVNILEKITGTRVLKIATMLENFNPESENFDRFGLGNRVGKSRPGINTVKNYPKLMVLGKPGAGKTTFLKHLAMECCFGNFMNDRIPIFITLKNFAEQKSHRNLQSYITNMFTKFGVAEAEIREGLTKGKALILLDGLDEVKEEDHKRILQEVENFSSNSIHSFVITCRIAAKEYTFDKFTEVEVADFDPAQIKNFVTKWFKCSKSNLDNGVDRFMKKLGETRQIKELATNPLLLTLLCLEFEDSGDFPENRSELYDRGIDTLLRRWDKKRGIDRDIIYKDLSIKRKEDLLGEIAAKTFKNNEYFFKTRVISSYIADYIQNLPEAISTDPEALEIDSRQVLKSIECQHGLLVERARDIYSFSHLTFQEYFTANKLITNCNIYSLEDENLNFLASKIFEKSWREVLLLSVEMLPNANCLLQLIKHQIDLFISDDNKLQKVLKWMKERQERFNLSYPAIYMFDLLIELIGETSYSDINDFSINGLRNSDIDSEDLQCDMSLIMSICMIDRLKEDCFFSEVSIGDFSCMPEFLESIIYSTSNSDFQESLRNFIDRLPKLSERLYDYLAYETKYWLVEEEEEEDKEECTQEKEKFDQLWEQNGNKWYQELKEIAIKYRDIGHDWQFSEEEKTKLKKYFDANNLLWEWIETTKSDRCYLTREIRAELKNTLLWPIEDIEKSEQKK